MKKLFVLFYALMCLVTLQAQKVTLQDVANGTYRAQSIQGLKPMLDGEHYTQISKDHKRIVKYSFKTGKEVATIFDVATARNHKLKSFDNYIMSPDESLDIDSNGNQADLPPFIHSYILYIQREKPYT